MAPRQWVLSFYSFQSIDDTGALREVLWRACAERCIKGTVLIAREGVNVALTGSRASLGAFLEAHFPGIAANWTPVREGHTPFARLKVRERAEIVTAGNLLDARTPVGRHVEPVEWNALLGNPDVFLLDVRNRYESDIGTFPGATPAATDRFAEFDAFARMELVGREARTVAMFCTGGIRCEKASAHLLARGFQDVRQLRGGILNYVASVPAADNAFAGECFVFDGRVSLAADGGAGGYCLCRACGRPTPKHEGDVCCGCRGE